ncbi:Lovastatin nonaketide synthase, related, partial [Eimeria necatrix]
MDPRQRVALEVSYEALLDAGVERGATDTDVTGVFVGSMNHETALEGGPFATAYTVTAAHISILSNRISYVNGFSGPSVTLDTACSSSLVALDFALSYMASQAISQAVVLGVNLMLRVEAYQQTCKAHMLSIDGRCKTFDASANGYVRSEGCGALLVKALPRHSTDPGAVYAWIRGAANNHVGRSASLTAPNGPAQQAVIRAALHDAQVKSPADVSVLEAHGTGTSLGDPIEVGAIRAVYCNGFADSPPLIVGALKSLMGHSEGAAGIAGLIKLILVLQHRMATPNLHLNMLNPHIDVTRSDKYRGLMFPSKCVPLDGLFGIHESQPLLGAVSSFGFGGSNAHAIVEVAPTFKSTWAVTGEPANATSGKRCASIVWLFTGQGSQYLDMACAYFNHSAVFRNTISECTACLKEMHWFPERGPQSIEDMIYGAGAQPDRKAMEELLSQTQYSQVAIVAVELGLSHVLLDRGMKPDVVIGHSLGEYAAAAVAGVMGWKDALRLVARRASLLAAQPSNDGIMVACRLPADKVQTALSSDLQHLHAVALAGDNAPQSVTIAGARDEVDTLLRHLGASAAAKRLPVSHAFHSPLMAGAVAEMEAIVSTVNLQPANIPIASTVRGRMLDPSEPQDPHYWGGQLTLPVRFREAVMAAVESCGLDHVIFVEVGPQRTLINLATQTIGKHEGHTVEMFNMVERGEAADEETLMERLQKCQRICRGEDEFISKHKWNHQSFEWRKISHPLIDSDTADLSTEPENGVAICEASVRNGTLSVLRDHLVWGIPILRGVGFIDAMLGAALARYGCTLGEACIELHNVAILKPMILYEGPETWGTHIVHCPTSRSGVHLKIRLEEADECTYATLSSHHAGGVAADTALSAEVTHAEGWISLMEDANSVKPPPLDVEGSTKRMTENMTLHYGAAEAYEELRRRGLEYGPCFQTIKDMLIAGNSALVKLQFHHEVADFERSFILHPSIFDGCVQAAALLAFSVHSCATALVPVRASTIRVWNSTRASNNCYWAEISVITGSKDATTESDGTLVSITLFDDSANSIAQIGTMCLQPVVSNQIFPAERDLGRGLLWGEKWIERKAWQTYSKPATQRRAMHWLVHGVETEDSSPLIQTVDSSTTIELHYASKALRNRWESVSLAEWDAVVHFGGACRSWSSAEEYIGDVMDFLQSIAEQINGNGSETLPPVVIVVGGASAVLPEEEAAHPLLAGVRGLCRTARLEMEAIANRPVPLVLLDIEPPHLETVHPTVGMLQQVASILLSPSFTKYTQSFAADGREYIETELAVRSGRVLSPQLVFSGIQLLPVARVKCNIGSGETFVISGGLGGLGLTVAHWLADNGANALILLSRTGTPPRDGATAKLWQQLIEKHSGTQIIVQRCDVCRLSDVKNLFDGIARGCLVCHVTSKVCFVGPLSGIFHSAGVLVDRPLAQQDRSSLELVFRPKVEGAWNMHNCLSALGMEERLKYFVMFSSSVGLLGNAGQANYAAANCCLDELARYRRSRGLVAHSIQWGPWVVQGMATQLKGRFAKAGFGGISNPLGLLALSAILQQNVEAVVGCQPLYWSRFLLRYKFGIPVAFQQFGMLESGASKSSAGTSGHKGGSFVEPAHKASRVQQKDKRERIKQAIMTAAKSVLNDSTDLSADAPLQELGIDSLGAIEFRDSVQNALNVRLSATVLFDHPTVDALTKFLLQEVSEDNDTESKPAALVEPVTPLEASGDVEAAVVGMACRFPGSDSDPSGFWRMLSHGIDCLSNIPENRFDVDGSYNPDPDAPGKMYVRQGGFIGYMDLFDNHFFHISDGEARQMDPRQRVSLEVAFEAVVDAGFNDLEDLKGLPIDVFVGSMNHEDVFKDLSAITAFTATSNAVSILANRISYFYSLTGQSVSVDTACSSSLVALCLSLPSLHSQERTALVVGVNALLSAAYFVQTCKAHMLSIDGRCKTFDASANGYVRSEGCGALLVKALPRHSTDPGAVYAWIRGAANNHVGRSASLTAPNGPAQQAVIRAALHDAQVKSPADVSVLEAHGTGTSLGDPIEVGAIRAVYCN